MKTCRNGFTLLELLVTIAILSIVTTMGFGSFVQIMGHARLNAKYVNMEHAVNGVFAMMEEDISAIMPTALSGVSVVGTTALEEKQRYLNIRLEDDAMVLPVALQQDGDVRPVSVQYRIDRSQEPPVLVRITGEKGSAEPQGQPQELLAGVWAMRIEYIDGESSGNTWNKPTLPRNIRVQVLVSDPDRHDEQISRSRLFEVPVP